MATITGTNGNDTLTVLTDTTSIQAGAGTDTAIFSGNYADYTFSQSDSYVPLMTHNTTGQVVSLYGVEQALFNDGQFEFESMGGGEVQVNTTPNPDDWGSIAALSNSNYVVIWCDNDEDYLLGQVYDLSLIHI